MIEVVLRQGRSKDIPALKRMLKPWCREDPFVWDNLDGFLTDTSGQVRCTVMESDKTIRSFALWIYEQADRVRLLALGWGPGAAELGAHQRLLREEILEWSELGISTARVDLPQVLAPQLIDPLRDSGFIMEGISSDWGIDRKSHIRLAKHFFYRTIPHDEVLNFLKEVMISMGYEVKPEEGGFRYRIREEFRRPFIFSSWHRIVADGPDIIVHPPARVLNWHDVESLFYPLRIYSPTDRPLVLPMDKARAERLVDLPQPDPRQNSLFNECGFAKERTLRLNNLTYCYPVRLKFMRKGLPLLFYVNKVGAVGAGRVEDYYVDEPKNLYNRIDDMGYFDPEDVKEYIAPSGPKAGKVLVMRFQWYRPFKRAISLEELRAFDDTFNPKRTRSLSSELFHAISGAGNTAI